MTLHDGLTEKEDERSMIGAYRVESSLGKGGMGEVLLAWDERLKRRVAIKRILKDGGSPESRLRFRREAQAVAQLNHPSIVQIYDLVETDEGDHIVMEYVEGISLDRLLRQGPLDVVTALEFARDVAEGLGQAHRKGLIHRDLKPANVRIAETEAPRRAKVLDFGLALIFEPVGTESETPAILTKTGAIVGTVSAMSPEQANGKPLDHRSDLFALGGLLYEMLAGEAPFRAKTLYATLHRIANEEPRPLLGRSPDITPAVESLVLRLLAKSPPQRPASAGRVAEELTLLLEMASGTKTHLLPTPVLSPTAPDRLITTARMLPSTSPVYEVPELLPYLSNRSRQRDQLVDVILQLRKVQNRRPLAVVIHGEEREAHDAFVDRLQYFTLPRMLGSQAEEPVQRYGLRWSVPSGTMEDRLREMERRLAEALTGARDADRTAWAHTVARHRCTTVISVMIRSPDHLRHEPELVRRWLEIFAGWPDLPPGQLLLPVLSLVDSQKKKRGLGLLQRWRPARSPSERLAETLRRETPEGLALVVLDRLERVREVDVHAWIEEHASEFLRSTGSAVRTKVTLRETLAPKVRQLYQQHGEGLPMETLALELRSHLEACLQRGESS